MLDHTVNCVNHDNNNLEDLVNLVKCVLKKAAIRASITQAIRREYGPKGMHA